MKSVYPWNDLLYKIHSLKPERKIEGHYSNPVSRELYAHLESGKDGVQVIRVTFNDWEKVDLCASTATSSLIWSWASSTVVARVRDGLKLNSIYVCEEENVDFITVQLPGVVVHSLYILPPEFPQLGQRIKPHIVLGDFNSHSTLWGYTTTDSNGEAVEQWTDWNRLSLIHNAKLPKSFNSAIWKKGYNPDLIFKQFGYVWEVCSGSNPPHTAPPYLCDCLPSYCATTYSIQNTL